MISSTLLPRIVPPAQNLRLTAPAGLGDTSKRAAEFPIPDQGRISMNKKPDWIEKRQLLRTEAEVIVSRLSPTAEAAAQPTEVLLRELLVHKIELEMQIDELQRAHTSMEEARDRYVDLYDFAPVGYVTIGRQCLIAEINLTGAAMFSVDRARLINSRFSKLVSPQDTDRWHRLFLNIMESADIEKQAFILEMARADGTAFRVLLECQRLEPVDAPPMLRCALVDISRIKQVEEEVRIAGAGVALQDFGG
jgi:PAS domain S-box-containing protein